MAPSDQDCRLRRKRDRMWQYRNLNRLIDATAEADGRLRSFRRVCLFDVSVQIAGIQVALTPQSNVKSSTSTHQEGTSPTVRVDEPLHVVIIRRRRESIPPRLEDFLGRWMNHSVFFLLLSFPGKTPREEAEGTQAALEKASAGISNPGR